MSCSRPFHRTRHQLSANSDARDILAARERWRDPLGHTSRRLRDPDAFPVRRPRGGRGSCPTPDGRQDAHSRARRMGLLRHCSNARYQDSLNY